MNEQDRIHLHQWAASLMLDMSYRAAYNAHAQWADALDEGDPAAIGWADAGADFLRAEAERWNR